MEYQNITLSIPKEILKKVKHIAVEKNTSVSGLLSRHLADIVARNDAYKNAKAGQMELMEKGFNLIGKRKTLWNREELHDRK
ncbi:MAG: CopG family transcriptional regulator [Peptococcaceae bacterium]|nr:MAG: CopG family transcriptional regulator [Peptococcaceae bacterium]